MDNTECEFALCKIAADSGARSTVRRPRRRMRGLITKLFHSVARELANCDEIHEMGFEFVEFAELADAMSSSGSHLLASSLVVGRRVRVTVEADGLAHFLDCRDMLGGLAEKGVEPLKSLMLERLARVADENLRESFELELVDTLLADAKQIADASLGKDDYYFARFQVQFGASVLEGYLCFEKSLESVAYSREPRTLAVNEVKQIARFVELSMEVKISPRIPSLLSLSELRVGDKVLCGGLCREENRSRADSNAPIFGLISCDTLKSGNLPFQVIQADHELLQFAIRRCR